MTGRWSLVLCGMLLCVACDEGKDEVPAVETAGEGSSTAGGATGVGTPGEHGDQAGQGDHGDQTAQGDHGDHGEAEPQIGPVSYALKVRVKLDGQAPGEPIQLKQGGVQKIYKTDAQGFALMGVQLVGLGKIGIHAAHPDARVRVAVFEPTDPPDAVEIELFRFDKSDNPNYKFTYPGDPDDLLGCGHCHNAIHKQWWGTAHQKAGSNPFVHDIYAGTVSAIQDQEECESAGGRWLQGLLPGTGERGFRCYLGPGALPDINPHCGEDIACDEVATQFGGCADCHTPGLNGKIGGRNLLEAVGDPYKFGIHCDVCHKVESVDLNAAPGVAGALKILRPTEKPLFPNTIYRPLHFGPYMDVSNFEMGPVQRKHFTTSKFCAGCHNYDTELKPWWGEVDKKRWPSGKLPVQSTYDEWLESPMNPVAPCGSCHMPPNADVWNSGDLERLHGGFDQGPRSGWVRPLGAVRDHTWVGPRTPGANMLELAADLEVDTHTLEDGVFEVGVTVKNVGPGHALPTGLPTRAMLMLVKAYCGDKELPAVGGNVVPDFAGLVSKRGADEDWTHWPEAKVGDRIRVLAYGGGWIDYRGPGPFGNGFFGSWQKGLRNMTLVSESQVMYVRPDGTVRLDKPLGRGNFAILSEEVIMGQHAPQKVAGAPGFAFGRVYADKDGKLGVPSFRAVDIVVDNRIRAQESFRSEHRFKARCAEPRVHAVLLYRSFQPDWVRQRRWTRDDVVMTEVFQ